MLQNSGHQDTFSGNTINLYTSRNEPCVVSKKICYVWAGQGQGNLSNLSAKSYSPSPCGFSLGPHTLDSCSHALLTSRHCCCLCGKGGKTSDIFTMYYC